jgi:hypothetical protein
MVRWCEFAGAEPEFAQQVHKCFMGLTAGTMATLRRDGSPRISGVNPLLWNGDLFLPMFFPNAVRVADLRRDPRLALHSPTASALKEDWSDWPGEAKIAGYGVETVIDPHQRLSAFQTGFRIDVSEVVRVFFGQADQFIIESWHEGRGLQRHERPYPRETRLEENAYWLQKNEWVEAGDDV